jgi:protein TonB
VQRRRSGALGVSVALHALLGSVLLVLSLLGPAPRDPVPVPARDAPVVYVMMQGPGGGGGGNPTPAPPRPLEIPRPTPVAPVPMVVEPVRLDPPPPPPLALQAPVFTNAAVLQAAGDSLVSLAVPGGGGRGRQGMQGGDGEGLGKGANRGTGGDVYEPGVGGVTEPEVVHKETPGYTTGALRSKIQGTVTMEAVVLPDGTVGDTRITGSLDPVHGLDQAALEAARRWRFRPATKDGQPVAVLVTLILDFHLR